MDPRKRRQLMRRRKRQRIKRLIVLGMILFLLVLLLIIITVVKNTKEKKAILNMLDNHYEAFLESTDTDDPKESDTAFSEWFVDKYLDGKTDKISDNADDKLTDQIIYKLSGESMHVLSDRFQNQISDKNHIYEREGNAKNTTIIIAGDLCFAEDGYVLDKYDEVDSLDQCISPELLEIMNQADIFYLNHEYCISDRGTPLAGKYYTFRAKPERMSLLKEMGTDLVALSNNHIYDYGEDALIDTTKLLHEASIPYVGGGTDISDAKKPVYFIVNGIKIGFVAASNAEKNRYTPQATEDSGGILLAYDTTEYNEVIQKASKECDYLIAYIHWGTEDSNYLNNLQQEMGREFLNSGADIVVGGHPHVLQGIEYVDGKPIIYSLGDFWFNDETKYTGLLELDIDYNGLKEMSFVPCQQTNYTTQYLDTAKEQEDLYSFLEELSINIAIDSDGIITEK